MCNSTDAKTQVLFPSRHACMCGFLRDAEPAESQLQSVRGRTPCLNGFASTPTKAYPCCQVDLMSFVSLAELNSVYGSSGDKCNDVWGWTDPGANTEIAIVGMYSGTAFLDVTDPENVVYLGKLPPHKNTNSPWRDIKTYKNYAYIVSEAAGHGMQVSKICRRNQHREYSYHLTLSSVKVFSLAPLVNFGGGPAVLSESNHYSGFGKAL